MAKNQRFYGWTLVAVLSAVVGVNLGFCYVGASVTNASMAETLGLSRSALGLGFAVFVLTVGLTAPFAAKAVSKFGPRRTIFAGSMLVGFGAFLLGTVVSTGWHYVLAYGLVTGMGTGLGALVPAQSCVTRWFKKKRALALALVLTGSGLAATVAAPMLTAAISLAGNDWRAGWYCLILMAVAVGILALFLVKDRPEDIGQVVDGVSSSEAAGRISPVDAGMDSQIHDVEKTWTLREASKSRVFWLITLAACGETVPGSAVIAHGVPHLRDLGHSVEVAAAAMSVYALASIFGKLGAGYLSDRFEARYIWAIFIFSLAASVYVATIATGMVFVYLFTALLGLGAGGSLAGWHAIIAKQYGAKSFANILGGQMPFTNAIAASAPFLVGLSFDERGSYSFSFYVITVAGVFLTTLLLVAWPKSNVAATAH